MLAGYPPFYDENPFGIYQKILAGKLEFPRHFETHARDLIRKLLTADRTKRIGARAPPHLPAALHPPHPATPHTPRLHPPTTTLLASAGNQRTVRRTSRSTSGTRGLNWAAL